MEEKKENKRFVGIDIIRNLALVCVVILHFFLHNGFYSTPMNSKRMLLCTIIRSFATIAVPLFLMITGYSMSQKKLSKKYYKGVLKVIGIYLLASVCCLLYEWFHMGKSAGFSKVFSGILNYNAAHYGWYVELYICLFLVIPFLNLIYNNLKDKKQKLILIGTMIFLTSLPAVVNVYSFFDASWWAQPSSSSEFLKVLPNFWVVLYPITYYFIGCYLKEYPIKMNKWINLLLFLLSGLLFGLYNYWHSYNGLYSWGEWQDSGSLLVLICAVLFFNFFINLDYSKVPIWVSNLLSKMSNLVFGAYLISFIFDDFIIGKIVSMEPDMPHRLEYMIVEVPLVLILSYFASFFINLIYTGMVKLCNRIKPKKIKQQP